MAIKKEQYPVMMVGAVAAVAIFILVFGSGVTSDLVGKAIVPLQTPLIMIDDTGHASDTVIAIGINEMLIEEGYMISDRIFLDNEAHVRQFERRVVIFIDNGEVLVTMPDDAPAEAALMAVEIGMFMEEEYGTTITSLSYSDVTVDRLR